MSRNLRTTLSDIRERRVPMVVVFEEKDNDIKQRHLEMDEACLE